MLIWLLFILYILILFISFMPIGVPKVAYRLPGEAVPQWVDLYNRLYRERVLFLGSGLDDELANQLNGIMLYLSAEDSNKRLFLYINSPGGSVTAGLSVFDIMNYVDASVTTIGIGFAASMASFILAGGERGSRIALPHCRIMIHQPQGGMEGQAWCPARKELCIGKERKFTHALQLLEPIMLNFPVQVSPMAGLFHHKIPLSAVPTDRMTAQQLHVCEELCTSPVM